jgi:sec-independent protein translocase protein TatC
LSPDEPDNPTESPAPAASEPSTDAPCAPLALCAPPPEDAPTEPAPGGVDGDARMSLGDHLDELRKRIIYSLIGFAVAVVVGLLFGRPLLMLVEKPYYDAMRELAPKGSHTLKALTPMEAVNVYLRVSVIVGLILASAWIFYQLWMFVSVGLYTKERRYVRNTLPFVAGLFVAGAMFFLFVVSTPILKALIEMSLWLGVEMSVTLENHVAFMTNMMLVFGITFQTPLVVVILAKIGLVSIRGFNHFRRHVVLAILIFTGIIAPPDAFSMMALAAPMWLLYEIGVLLAWLMVRNRPAPDSE